MDRDFVIFRWFGFSEFRAKFHAGLIELTIQIAYQRIGQSAARALSHILPTPIDALCLTPMVFVPLSVRWITCGQSAFTMSHVFSASATGVPTDRACIHVSNPPERVRALSRTFMHFYASTLHILPFMRHVQLPTDVQYCVSAPTQGYVYVLKCGGPLFYLIAATSSSNSFQAS